MATAKLTAFLCFFILCVIMSNSRPVFAQTKPAFACDIAGNPELKKFRFCDTSLDVKTRVDDLVKRLTLQEKIGWIVNTAKGVSRLGIPNYEWWSEILHGISFIGPGSKFMGPVPGATSFPQVILTAATFNVSLYEAIGKAVSTEARAMYNEGLAGLTFWSPNINIYRDPRWGRGQETPGEDPLLSSRYGAAYVRGLQQRDDGNKEKLKIAACCKHYTAYDLDDWKGFRRYNFNAMVSQQDLDDTYNPPFKSCVLDGNVASVMCSYNQINGRPTCGDRDLLYGVIRGQWKLNGYIVTDCDSIHEMFNSQRFRETPEETAALALNAGLDLNCGSSLTNFTQGAVDRGLVNETVISRAVSNNFATMMRLGFFDGNPKNHLYGNLGAKDICTTATREFAREVARQGFVLLKNTKGSLPLSSTAIKNLAVIGPNAAATEAMLGSYFGLPCKYTSPLEAIKASVSTVLYQPGCADVWCATPQVEDAKKIASEANAVVLIMGLDQNIEREALDRMNVTLPGQQELLITEVAKVSKGPVILVIMSGGSLDIQFAKDNPKVSSILWVGYPGEAGGAAIADVIFGICNPGGRLPMTWYPQSYVDKVNMTNMNFRPNPATGFPGRTYRFYKGKTVYPFGYGLSYSAFSHHLVEAPEFVTVPLEEAHVCRTSTCKSIDSVDHNCNNLAFDIHLGVKNTGKFSGSHTVLLFSSPPELHNAPQKQLIGFEKLHLMPQEDGVVQFKIDVCKHLSVVDETGKWKVALGQHMLHVGSLKHPLNVRI